MKPREPFPETATRWRVHTLPRQDEISLELYLVTPTDDPAVIDAIEAAAVRAGMALTRQERL